MTDSARVIAEARIRRVAQALGPVRERLVFIGASVLPLLVDVEARLSTPRATKDVDAVAGTIRYTEQHDIEMALRTAGFKDDMHGHIGRWHAPFGEIFDLSYAGQHLGGTGSAVDMMAIATAIVLPGDPPIRHVNGVGLFLMKTAAFGDRGTSAPHDSKDLADLAVLLVGRSVLHEAVASADPATRQAVRDAATRLLENADLAGALRSHFRDRQPVPPDTPDDLATEVTGTLSLLAAIAEPAH